MRNTGDRYGGAITAGLFLKTFVEATRRGCTSTSRAPPRCRRTRPSQPKGGTGFAVATIVEYATSTALLVSESGFTSSYSSHLD